MYNIILIIPHNYGEIWLNKCTELTKSFATFLFDSQLALKVNNSINVDVWDSATYLGK